MNKIYQRIPRLRIDSGARPRPFAWCLAAVVLAGACGLSGPLRVDPKAKLFTVGPLSSDWTKVTPEEEADAGADLVYVNRRSSAYIAVNSICKRYPDSSLASLAKQLMAPLTKPEIESQDKVMIDEREALATKARGLLDGVPVEGRFVVVRKNECIFDFSLVAGKQVAPEDEASFNQLVGGFKYLGGVKE